MSDSDDDFMSDKFLVEAPSTSKTYSQQRHVDQLKSLRRGQANNKPSLAQLEKERRAEGLSRSLFDTAPVPEPARNGEPSRTGTAVGLSTGGNKAMAMMQKMGWKVGEGLGKQRSPPPAALADSGTGGPDPAENTGTAARGGIGSRHQPGSSASGSKQSARVEPIRISLWAGRKGLTARSPSPPPLRTSSGRDVDYLDPSKMARLGKEADSFREFQRRQFGEKEAERKAAKAREMLIRYDEERGVQYHPLHVSPFDPLGTLPPPLLRLIYPAQALALSPSPSASRSPSPPPLGMSRDKTLSAAERTRQQMRRDMLQELADGDSDGEGDGHDQGAAALRRKRKLPAEDVPGKSAREEVVEREYDRVVWADHISGTKRVLGMDTETYLTFLLSQLRNEHHFCFWCGTKYGSFEEMDGPGGCPGEDEDDH